MVGHVCYLLSVGGWYDFLETLVREQDLGASLRVPVRAVRSLVRGTKYQGPRTSQFQLLGTVPCILVLFLVLLLVRWYCAQHLTVNLLILFEFCRRFAVRVDAFVWYSTSDSPMYNRYMGLCGLLSTTYQCTVRPNVDTYNWKEGSGEGGYWYRFAPNSNLSGLLLPGTGSHVLRAVQHEKGVRCYCYLSLARSPPSNVMCPHLTTVVLSWYRIGSSGLLWEIALAELVQCSRWTLLLALVPCIRTGY